MSLLHVFGHREFDGGTDLMNQAEASSWPVNMKHLILANLRLFWGGDKWLAKVDSLLDYAGLLN